MFLSKFLNLMRDSAKTSMRQVLNQDETPLLYSLVFGEGVVNDATSVVIFNALQKFDLSHIRSGVALRFAGSLSYLFLTSTLLGVAVSSLFPCSSLCLLVMLILLLFVSVSFSNSIIGTLLFESNISISFLRI